MSRELYLDRDDIDLVVAALRGLAGGYRKAAASRPGPDRARYPAMQAGRCVNLAQRLGRFPSALVSERPRA